MLRNTEAIKFFSMHCISCISRLLFLLLLIVGVGCNNQQSEGFCEAYNPRNIIIKQFGYKCEQLLKQVKINNKVGSNSCLDTSILATMDFLEEVDISKPSFKGVLKVDSVISKEGVRISLHSKEPALLFREAIIIRRGRKLTIEKIILQKDNFLMLSRKEVVFERDKLDYSITGVQHPKMGWSEPINYKIHYSCN